LPDNDLQARARRALMESEEDNMQDDDAASSGAAEGITADATEPSARSPPEEKVSPRPVLVPGSMTPPREAGAPTKDTSTDTLAEHSFLKMWEDGALAGDEDIELLSPKLPQNSHDIFRAKDETRAHFLLTPLLLLILLPLLLLLSRGSGRASTLKNLEDARLLGGEHVAPLKVTATLEPITPLTLLKAASNGHDSIVGRLPPDCDDDVALSMTSGAAGGSAYSSAKGPSSTSNLVASTQKWLCPIAGSLGVHAKYLCPSATDHAPPLSVSQKTPLATKARKVVAPLTAKAQNVEEAPKGLWSIFR